MTKQIPLTQGKYALVDDDVYEWASQYRWCASNKGNTSYAVRNVGNGLVIKRIHLHREIMNAPHGTLVDHINGDGLNCTRANMRLASRSENNRNSCKQINNTSGFKGVYWNKNKNKWHAQIRANNRRVHIGLFPDIEQAARAYDVAARKYHGEFAKTNFTG